MAPYTIAHYIHTYIHTQYFCDDDDGDIGCHKFIAAGLANSPLYPAVSTHDDGEAVRLTAPEPLPPLLPPMLPQSSFAHPSPSTSQPLPSPVAAHPSVSHAIHLYTYDVK